MRVKKGRRRRNLVDKLALPSNDKLYLGGK
jgi:hypothetical protein